jgi:hypothetical protein
MANPIKGAFVFARMNFVSVLDKEGNRIPFVTKQ